MRPGAAALAAAVLLTACSAGPEEQAAPTAAPTEAATASPTPTPTSGPTAPPQEDGPALAPAPEGDVTLWLDTIGIPVVAAVRTSTQLARLASVPRDQWEATCRQVATDLDGIAPPQVLTGLAITADAETATLLVGDLQAKGDLLAVCLDGGPELEERIVEVEQTHAVAVAWLDRLRGDA